jgi:hypothetical protein
LEQEGAEGAERTLCVFSVLLFKPVFHICVNLRDLRAEPLPPSLSLWRTSEDGRLPRKVRGIVVRGIDLKTLFPFPL